ncbi:MAG: hypothetical protein E7513_06440 [Ruminococcaceae bacterium]|nr:hypothetical protein [Oscillospiraceae bacterium]
MPDSMQNEAMERLKQMYSKAQPQNTQSKNQRVVQQADTIPEFHHQEKQAKEEVHTKKSENFLDIFLKDKEKSLILLLIVLLISEKADTTLVLALMYLIL